MNLLYLYALMSVEGTLLGAELVASQLTHSLIILTDAYRTLYNILSIILLIISFKMSTQTSVKNTFGWARIEVLGMLVNMTFLVALTFSLIVEGIQQLVHFEHEISEPTNYYLLFTFGFCGFILNLLYFNIVSDAITSQNKQRTGSLRPQEKIVFNNILGLRIEERPSTSGDQTQSKQVTEKLLASKQEKEQRTSTLTKEHTHQQNVFYGMFRDLTGSVLLILCGVCIFYTNNAKGSAEILTPDPMPNRTSLTRVLSMNDTLAHIADPILGMISALIFCAMLYPNLKNTGLILLQTVPENINVGRLRRDILREFPIIVGIHDLHVWGLTASRIIATCHIILPNLSSEAYDEFSKSLKDFFHGKGIFWATVQPEFQSDDPNQTNPHLSCIMKCSKFSNMNCDSYACCTAENNDCGDCNETINLNDDHTLQEMVNSVDENQ